MTKVAKLTREQLGVQKDEMIVIEGTVSYARVDKLVEGEALAAESKRRVGLGMMAAEKPFRSISITEPRIVKGEGTPLAAFHGQSVYEDKNGKKAMSLESKSQFAPKYGHIQNNVLVEIPDPMKNPAPGQKVLLFIQAYGSKQYTKIGSSFNAIVFPEGEIKFYEGGNGGNGLAGFGQALDLPVQNLSGQAPEPANMLQQPTSAPVEPSQPVNNGFGTAPAQPVTNGFGTAPVQQPSEPAQTPAPSMDEQFSGFGQATPQPQTAGQTSNPFA